MRAVMREFAINRQPAGRWRPGDCAEALNVVRELDGPLARRPGLRLRATAPAGSAGLYAIGDLPHVAAPEGTDITGLSPTLAVDLLRLGSGTAVEAVAGAVADASGRAAVLVRTNTDALEFHLSPGADVPPAAATQVSLGFSPVFAAPVKVAARVWLLDAGLGPRLGRFSAVDDPGGDTAITEWGVADPDNPAANGGFLNIGQHAGGGGPGVALGEFAGRLVFLFGRSAQVWRVGGDPDTDAFLEDVIQGPGVNDPGAVAQAGRDLLFLTPDATVQSLGQSKETQAATEAAIGSPVQPLVAGFVSSLLPGVACYSRSRGLWLLAFGQDVLVLRAVPGIGYKGWTRWRLPVAVDAMCDAGGRLWMRSGTAVYSFEDDQDDDEVALGDERPVPVRIETQRLIDGPDLQQIVRVWGTVVEDCVLQVVRDGRPALAPDGTLPTAVGSRVLLPGRAPEPSAAVTTWTCRTMAFRIHDEDANAGWRLDELGVEARGTRQTGVS